ncbi:SlyX family protein [Bdellovibrio sp. SKB1291214]|uniref:SlyX family protein n=1 Tax=Bdellovibrio sp. SKB1291214 TaxID=1732569 RepID=UPI000B515620|nr:SlyX family protein [Bdellovibrio sp. SKB1291214]UYL07950.1 SlyX family protein [Bdellovibrio sp. SKB1291214]
MDERLTNLEIKVAHQDHVIEELHQVIYEQQKTIDKLETLLSGLTRRLQEALSDEGSEIRGNEKPPHY